MEDGAFVLSSPAAMALTAIQYHNKIHIVAGEESSKDKKERAMYSLDVAKHYSQSVTKYYKMHPEFRHAAGIRVYDC